MAGHRCHRFGHAPAIARQGPEDFANLADQFWGGGCAAISYRLDTGEIVVLAFGMFEQLPCDRRHTPGRRYLFPLDDLERFHGIPLVHEHDRVSCGDISHQSGGTCRHVEQGNDHQSGLGLRIRQRLPTPHEGACRTVSTRQDIRAQIAMSAKRALGPPRCPAGVENGRIVIRQDRHVRQRARGQIFVPWRRADDALQTFRPVEITFRTGDQHGIETGADPTQRTDAIPAFLIANQQFGTRIRQAISQLVPRPPGVERNADGTDRDGGEECHWPFGQIAHRKGYAIALAHAARLHRVRQRRDRAKPSVIRDPLVFIYVEQAIAMRLAQQGYVAKIGRGVFPGANRDASDLDLFHLEALAGCRQDRLAMCAAYDRPIGGG